MSDKIENIENLLKKIEAKNQHKQQIAEDFNIFEILGVAHLEVSTHSAFIANLLNPKGSHSQGARFLEKFLELIDVKVFNLSSAQVEVEKHIGDLGRIDIFITDNTNWAIAIENKIYAGLGEKQLGRYMEFLKGSKMPNKKLVYLTLQKSNKKDEDNNLYRIQGVKEEDFGKCKHISYNEKIVNWLKQFDSSNPQKISTTILQYIQTIERLTNMSNDKEFYEIINSKEAYEAYKKIISLDYRKYKIETLLTEIANKIGLDWKFTKNFYNGGRESGIEVDLSKNENPIAKLCLIFEETNYKKLYIGIYSEKLDENLKEKLKKSLNNAEWKSVNSWVAWKYWNEINSDVIEDLCFNSNAEENKKNLIEKLNDLKTAWMEINKPSES
ncbi:MAG: hypothetical protein E7036_10035 [Opitutales bacterium]|nr:hypothetical protein [Opitutales bacterium]